MQQPDLTQPQVRVATKNAARSNAEEAKRKEVLLRAKTILMAKNHWDEPQAYRFLRQKSMDCRKSINQIAEALVLSEELLIPR